MTPHRRGEGVQPEMDACGQGEGESHFAEIVWTS